MAFWSDINSNQNTQVVSMEIMPDCHKKINFKDCKSICCLDHEIYATNYCIQNNNKKKFDKIKHCFIDLEKQTELDFTIIWNNSPPDKKIIFNNKYISLIPSVKSNT